MKNDHKTVNLHATHASITKGVSRLTLFDGVTMANNISSNLIVYARFFGPTTPSLSNR